MKTDYKALVLSAACLCFIFPIIGEAVGLHDEAIRYRDEGYRLQQRGELPNALQAYQKAAAMDASDPILHYYFGLYYQQTGELNAAENAFAYALRLNPNYQEVLWNLAGLKQQQGHMQEALRLWLTLGVLYEQGGDLQRAEQALTQVLEIEPNALDANMHLAAVQERLGKANDAALHWSKVGLLEEQHGEPAAAKHAYERVAALNPNAVEAQANLAKLEDQMGHREAAVVHWLRAGYLYDQQGQVETALQAYHRALALNPKSIEALASLAVLSERRGDRAKAVHYWTQCQELGNINDPWIHQATQRLIALGVVTSGPLYHRYVVEHALEANRQSLDEFDAVTDMRQQR